MTTTNKSLAAPTWDQLSPEQKQAVEDIRKFPYSFLTGGAGVGKSSVIKFLIENEPSLEPLGSTGVAALNISGKTLHSWASIGLGDMPAEVLYSQLKHKRWSCDRLRKSSHILIDEISMIDGETLDKVDYILRKVRGINKPFGGIRTVLCGDALQLPCVSKEKGFFFQSKVWTEMNPKVIVLDKVFRQKDSNFADVLGKLRLGIVDEQVVELIERAKTNKVGENGVKPVILHSTNAAVDKENQKNYEKLAGEENVYYAVDSGEESAIKNIDKNCPAQKVLKLKVNTQVMLLSNLDTEGGLVNGSIGVVDGFSAGKEPIVKFNNGRREVIGRSLWETKEVDLTLTEILKQKKFKVLASRQQIPLRAAWSQTIHKCQGSTLDCVEVDLSKAFEAGQIYVAMSRVKDEKGLYIRGINYDAIKAHPLCLDFYGYDGSGKRKQV